MLACTVGEYRDIARSTTANAATSPIAKQSEMPAWLIYGRVGSPGETPPTKKVEDVTGD